MGSSDLTRISQWCVLLPATERRISLLSALFAEFLECDQVNCARNNVGRGNRFPIVSGHRAPVADLDSQPNASQDVRMFVNLCNCEVEGHVL